ncbi:peptidoglycan DD-metalloendopeptidase family protein [Chitinimonas sp. PSY-7]|uniref:peptidoglycan DD-metalloendopeptidase family protein n=1 Tax=Chitinimonas sp. PSY-7 TaxID=3459088 RepID=UPI0040402774
MHSHRVTQLALLLLSSALPCHVLAAEPSPNFQAELQKATSQAMLLQLQPAQHKGVLVEVQKTHPSKQWVMGSATLLLPDHIDEAPETRLFMGQYVKNNWLVGIEGTDQFKQLIEQAPDNLFVSGEKPWLLKSLNAPLPPELQDRLLADIQTGLGLPWAENDSWRLTGGAHGDDQTSRPYNSLDFAGGDGVVRAPRDGRIYQSCVRNGSGLISIVHDNGFSTSYYHMKELTNLGNGVAVAKGTYLGRIGVGLPCGGSTTGPHVHFALKQGGNKTAVDSKIIGGWTFREGGRPYEGYAIRNGTRVNVGGSLRNYGGGGSSLPMGSITPGKGNDKVNLRQSPSLNAPIVGSLPNGETVTISCTAQGDWVDGVWGRTQLWNWLTINAWVSDGFLDTGSNQAVAPPCAASPNDV